MLFLIFILIWCYNIIEGLHMKYHMYNIPILVHHIVDGCEILHRHKDGISTLKTIME